MMWRNDELVVIIPASLEERPLPHPLRPFVLFASLAFVPVLGCAANSATVTASQPATTIEVANRTPHDYAVFLDGQHAASLQSGQRALIDNVVSGKHRLTAQPGHGDYPELHQDVKLARAGKHVWELMPPDPSLAVAVPDGFGDIDLHNALDRDQIVSLDGEPVATVLAQDTRTLQNIPAGLHHIVARPVTGFGLIERDLTVTSGSTLEVALDGPRGDLEILNDTGERVAVTLDGRGVGEVGVGETLTLWKTLAGVRTIQVVGQVSQRTYRREVLVAANQTTYRALSANDGDVRVDNKTPESVHVEVDDMMVGRLEPGESRLFSKVSPGDHVLTATAMISGFQFRMPVRITTDQTFVWPLTLDEGVLLAENRTNEVYRIYDDGDPFLSLQPGEHRYISQLPVGRYHLVAYGQTSGRIIPQETEIRAADTAQLTIVEAPSSLAVENQRDERVRVFLDAAYLGEVAPEETGIFDGIVPGEHLVESLGLSSSRVFREHPTLLQGERGVVTVGDPRGAVAIVNNTAEVLTVGPKLRMQGPTIPVGSSYAYWVPTGKRKLTLKGASTGHTYERELDLEEGDSIRWVVAPLVGSVQVFNHRDEAITVYLDEREVARIGPSDSRLIEDLPVGHHDLLAEGQDTGSSVRASRKIQKGPPNHWQVGHELGILIVNNDAGEDVDVFIDSRPYGFVAAKGFHAFGNIPAGSRTLMVVGQRTHESQESIIAFEEGRTERYRVKPLQAMLRVLNQRTEAVSVFLDGELVGNAPAKGVFEGFLEQGPHTVETRTEGELSSTLKRFRASPYQTYDVEVHPDTGRLRVTNLTGGEIELRRDESLIGTVEAGATRLFDALPIGVTGLHARSRADDDRVWALRARIDGDKTLEWVVDGRGLTE